MSAATPLPVFLVDDEQPARERMKEVLGDLATERANVVVAEAANGREGLALLSSEPVDVALVDIHMPLMDGIEFARHLTTLENPPAVVFVTAHDQHAIEAFEVNEIDYLLKTVSAQRIGATLAMVRSTGATHRR